MKQRSYKDLHIEEIMMNNTTKILGSTPAIQCGTEHKIMLSYINQLWEQYINDPINHFQTSAIQLEGDRNALGCSLTFPDGVYQIDLKCYTTGDLTNLHSVTTDCCAVVADLEMKKISIMEAFKYYWIPDDMFFSLYNKTCKKLGYNQSGLSDFANKFFRISNALLNK